jgi:hypothetical protein
LALPHSFAMENWSSSPYINRFVSADTIVPGYTNPQSLNRYSYVLNNPLRYTDPTGHRACGDGEEFDCNGNRQDPNQNPHPLKSPKDSKDKDKGKDKAVTVLQNVATGLDIVAWGIDLYNVGVVTYGGIFGAGVALPFAEGGPEIPAVTGLAGIGLAELYVQPTLQLANGVALVSTLLTAAADIRSGETDLKTGVVGKNTLNSVTTTTYGFKVPEAYSSLVLQSIAISNDLGWTSFPFPQ